jgi:predicted TIM-barrel fold metal-dependent hydrolase
MKDFEIIDCHIHPFCREAENTCFFPGTVNADSFVDKLRRSGITKCCGSVIRKLENPTFEEIKELNREAIKFRNSYPGFFIPGVHVHANYPEESCRELETLHATENICWIGELVAYFFDYKSYVTAGMNQVYELAQDLNLPINIHPYGLDEIEQICQNFPKLPVVIAHPTADKNGIIARYELIRKYQNAYLDLSGSGLFRWGMLKHGINIAGKHKFLFGTDFPICNPAMMIEAIKFELTDDDELEAIFSGNFKRLTGI